jgi:bile acid-coenzyme A ligase
MPIRSYGRALRENAERIPDAVAFVHGDQVTTHAELEVRANRLARAFAKRGVVEGDFVTLALPNGIELVAALFACWKLGATPQPVSTRLPAPERDAILDLVAPRLVVGLPVDAAAGRPALPAGFDASGEDPGPLPDRVSRYRMAICSGGSTGRPKVIVDHIPGESDPMAPFHGLPAGSSILVPGPLYHSGPLINCLSVLLGGGKVVIMSRFEAAEALRLIEAHRLQLAIFVPTMLLRIWKLPEAERNAFDLSSIHRIVSASATLPDWLQREWIEWIGPDRVWEAYGGSERIGGTIISGREWLEKPGSVGRVSEGRKLKIVGPDGSELPPGEIGEVYCMPPGGPGSTYHYLGAEPRRLPDGWETLGDLGHLDEDGYLFLADRRTDLIICGGANIYPAEVEGAIESHPDVLSCAVIGLPDEDLGAIVHAIVQTAAPLDAATLETHLRDRIAHNKIPRSFELVSEPLKDDAGKVRRAALRAERIEGKKPVARVGRDVE